VLKGRDLLILLYPVPEEVQTRTSRPLRLVWSSVQPDGLSGVAVPELGASPSVQARFHVMRGGQGPVSNTRPRRIKPHFLLSAYSAQNEATNGQTRSLASFVAQRLGLLVGKGESTVTNVLQCKYSSRVPLQFVILDTHACGLPCRPSLSLPRL
jgi:hypothetical protein